MFSCVDFICKYLPCGTKLSVRNFVETTSNRNSGLRGILLLLICLSFLSPQKAHAQYANEEELKKQAAQFFEDEDYANGYKAYSQLVANYPKDPNYNYRLGVCMLYTEPDKKKSYVYLEFANKNIKDCEKEAKFYLAKAYHINFRFDEAIKLYSDYKAIAGSGMAKKLQVDMEIQACKNGKRLLSNLNELVVLEKKQLAEGEYFRSYNLKDIGGKLLVKPAEYLTTADKKKKNKSIVYLPKSNDQLYYSSYGSGDNKDIYIVRKLPNGEWSKPQSLGAPVNTAFDEDYPFLHPNGRVLYFASKGHNSMGGYDLFKSEFNESTRTWGKPENLNFPINTPNDDILFVTDSLEKTAYFSSTRQSPVGKIDVFKINTERRPPEFIYIKGKVLKQNENQSVASRISVKDIGAGENVGNFQAGADGSYLLKIPNGGKFIFTVETPGFTTQSEGIDIPVNNSLLPYKQSIGYEAQTLVVKNFFETNKDDENAYKDYIEIIEEKSKMDVNASDFTTPANTNTTTATTNTTGTNTTGNNTGNSTTGNTNTTGTATNANVSNQQLEKIAFDDAKELQEEAVKLKSDANDAFTFVNNQKFEADQKEKEALQAIENANSETDPSKKEPLLNKANELKEEAKKLEDQATLAENIAKQLDQDANTKQKEAELQQKYAEALQQVNKSKNNKDALTKLEAIQKELEQISTQKNTTNELANSIKNEAIRKDEEVNKLEPSLNKIKNEVADIQKEMSDIEKEISATKDKNLLDNLKAQKEDLNTELTAKNTELKKTEDKISLLKKESDALKSQSDFASNMLSEVKSTEDLTAINTTTSNINNSSTNTNNTGNTTGTNTTGNNNSTAIGNNTTSTTNNTSSNSGNTTTASETLTGIQKEKKDFEEQSTKLNARPESSARYADQNNLINTYIAAVDKEIADQKSNLKKAKNNTEKTAISTKIKELEADKKDKQDDKKINDSKIAYFKNIENNTVANNNTTGNTTATTNTTTTTTNNTTTTNTTTATSNTTTATTNTSTTATNNTGNNTNNTAFGNELTTLGNEAGSFTNPEEQELFSNNNYSSPAANTLQQQAVSEYNNAVTDAKNTANKITTAQNSLQNNTKGDPNNKEKINQLNNEADNLYSEASDLRKKTNTLSGTAKQENLNKIKELEMQASNKKFESALLIAKDNENSYSKNEKTLNEYTQANGNKSNAEIVKANKLLNESKTLYSQAMRIEEEANAEQDVAAKSASYSNVEDKEIQALKKQEEAIALFKKNNPSFTPTTENGNNNALTENNISTIKNELNSEEQAKIKALEDLAAANKEEYGFVAAKLEKNEAQTNGTNSSIEQKEADANVLFNEANSLLANTGNTTSVKEKTAMLIDANKKLKLAISKINEANAESEQLQANGNTTTTNNTTNNTTGNNTAANNTTGNNTATNNTGNPTTNTNTTGNNTNTGNNTTNTGNTTATTNTVVPSNGKLSETQIKAVQITPEYKNYTTLTNEAAKYEGIAEKESIKAQNFYEQATMYLKESNDLRIQLDQLPNGEERQLKQEQAVKLDRLANEYKAKGDSVNELANNTKSFAESKKMEMEAYSQSLDKKTYDNILIASGAQSNNAGTNTAATNTNNTNATNNSKYAEYSPAFRDNATKLEEDLNSFAAAEENESNLSAKNTLLNNYNKAIDTEIANERKKLTTASTADKTKINQRITKLQNQKGDNNKAVAANTAKIKALSPPVTNNNTTNTNNTGNTTTTNTTTANNTNNTNNTGNTNTTNTNNTATNNTTNNTATNTGGNNTATNTTNNTAVVNTSGIGVKNTNAYSADSPIPIDEKLPNGIIFAVQIGAFKNQIPNDLFKGLSPLRGETTSTGFIRYQAGRFEKFDDANAVRNDLKKLGYKDAFVVVYKNGQRMSLAEAINELKQQGVSVNNDPNQTAGITINSNVPTANAVANTLNNNTGNNTAPNNTGNQINTNNSAPTAVNSTDLNDIQGMLFTVQIGVYSNQISSNQLYNLKPIYRERMPNGYYRYTAGIYNNIDRVKTDRAKVNALGINDAFVSAYQNGQKIKIADALAKINAGENVQFPPENPIQFDGASSPVTTTATTAVTNTTTTTNNTANNQTTGNTTAPFNNGVTQGPQPTPENGVKVGDEGITFKIQIGAYKNQVPQNVAGNFLKIKNWPIQAGQINGLYIYTVGSFVDGKFARPLLEEAKSNGIADAFITVYKDGKKLYGAEASTYLSR